MSRETVTLTVEIGGEEHELEVRADYTPERPPPACQDHDSPAFSDPGDSEECEIIRVTLIVPAVREDLALRRRAAPERRITIPEELWDIFAVTEDDVAEKLRERDDEGLDVDAAYDAWKERDRGTP